MIDRDAMYKMFQENPQQQEMLNYVLTEVAKAAKANFPAYLKMVQMDVTNAVLSGAKKDNMVGEKLTMLTDAVDEMMKAVGTDIEKHIEAQHQQEKADPNGYIPG